MQINKIQPNINFGTTSRSYISEKLERKVGCNSWFFRDDINWNKLAKYEIEHFKDKNKVNIIMFAASDGSEAYTKIISLMEKSDNTNKFFPIEAYDVDEEIIKASKSGIIKTVLPDRKIIDKNTKNFSDYFEITQETREISNDIKYKSTIFYKAKNKLTNNVKFNKGDMFNKIFDIKDNSNTILMCRNILGYFWSFEVDKFIQIASKVLKTGSLFAIGEYDSEIHFNINKIMKKYGFKKVMKNVFKKI